MPIVLLSFEEFCRKQGCEFLPTEKGYIFENGSLFSDASQYCDARNADPPEHPLTLARRKLLYAQTLAMHKERQAKECTDYIKVQTEYHQMNAGPLPDPKSYEDLKRLRQDVSNADGKIAILKSEINELLGPRPVEKYIAYRDEQRAAARESQQRLYSILHSENPKLEKVEQ